MSVSSYQFPIEPCSIIYLISRINRKSLIDYMLYFVSFKFISEYNNIALLKPPLQGRFGGRCSFLHQYILCYSLSIQHAYNAVAIAGIVFTVGNHYYGSTLFIQFSKQFHYFITIVAVQVSGRLIRKY
jgi:hypothetical protein